MTTFVDIEQALMTPLDQRDIKRPPVDHLERVSKSDYRVFHNMDWDYELLLDDHQKDPSRVFERFSFTDVTIETLSKYEWIFSVPVKKVEVEYNGSNYPSNWRRVLHGDDIPFATLARFIRENEHLQEFHIEMSTTTPGTGHVPLVIEPIPILARHWMPLRYAVKGHKSLEYIVMSKHFQIEQSEESIEHVEKMYIHSNIKKIVFDNNLRPGYHNANWRNSTFIFRNVERIQQAKDLEERVTGSFDHIKSAR